LYSAVVVGELFRIGELSRRSGVSPELLRAWERRYGLLQPLRSPGGLRLYSSEDLDRVRVMREHLAGGLAAAEAANAANALGGSPVLAVRVSTADERERHRGVSHHTRAVVELCLGRVAVAWPRGLEAPDWLGPREEVDVTGWEEACAGLPLAHMGRGFREEPWFFASAFAAGRLARGLAR
jgi:DNA-binding transcriptional MerR regulator